MVKGKSIKLETTQFCIYAWGVLRKLFDWSGLSICQVAHHELELELYLGAMQYAENDAIAILDFEVNSELNATPIRSRFPLERRAVTFLREVHSSPRRNPKAAPPAIQRQPTNPRERRRLLPNTASFAIPTRPLVSSLRRRRPFQMLLYC